MSGYTPLFGSLTSGTLCGRWPDIGLWPIVLSLADKNGVVDATQVYIASVTGLSIDEVTACMTRFCQPDPHSRSDAEGGARLVLLDEHRSWGWRIVNFGTYREKARLMAKAASEVISGKNASRMADRRRPPETAADPLSDSYADSDAEKRERERARAGPEPGAVTVEKVYESMLEDWRRDVPECNATAFSRWVVHVEQMGKPMNATMRLGQARRLAGQGALDDQAEVVEFCIEQGYRTLIPISDVRARTRGMTRSGAPAPVRTWRPGPED